MSAYTDATGRGVEQQFLLRRLEQTAQEPETRASFIEHYNATFDFEAGLDDVYSRAGLARPKTTNTSQTSDTTTSRR